MGDAFWLQLKIQTHHQYFLLGRTQGFKPPPPQGALTNKINRRRIILLAETTFEFAFFVQ